MTATTLNPVDRVLDRLEQVKSVGSGWTARCPAHDDQHNSLKIDLGGDGQALIYCHALCPVDRVVAALGLTFTDLYPPRTETVSQNGHGTHIAETYDYRDETGAMLYQVVRFEPKDFRQRRPDDNGGWSWKLGDTPRVLYRFPELLAADPSVPVLIPEGEKDVDRLTVLGFVATTNAGGAGKWRSEYTSALHGRRVVLIPDNDEPGERHMQLVAHSLYGVATEVRLLRPPGLPPKGDLSDWLNAGHTDDEFRQLIATAPAWEPTNEAPAGEAGQERPSAPRLVIRALSDVTAQPVDWLWPRWLARGKFHLLGGHAGDGKSSLAAAIAAIGSCAGSWPDGMAAPRFRTLFVLGEDSLSDTLRPRLDLFGADTSQILAVETVLDERGQERFFDAGKHLDLLEATITEHAISALVVDPLTTIMSGRDRNAEGDTRDALTPLIKLAERRNVAVLGIAHVGKPSAGQRTAAQRILGATAFHAMARTVWMTARLDEERMALGVVKSNLAMKPETLSWSRAEDAPIVWHGVAGQEIDDLLSGSMSPSPRADAEGFLREFLIGGMKPCREVERVATSRGISKSTLRRAAEAIPVKKWKGVTADAPWYWGLPAGQPAGNAAPPAPGSASAPDVESKMLTPIDTRVSIFDAFDHAEDAHPRADEHLRATTPVYGHSASAAESHVMEGVEDAHVPVLRGEHLRPDASLVGVPSVDRANGHRPEPVAWGEELVI